jgi:phosphodiesterase/alkaline phosphatase D-like protein
MPASSQIEYGTSSSYGFSTAADPTLVASHQQSLSNLKVGTLYHYRVKSTDANNHSAVGVDMTFTTVGDTT